MKRPRVLMYGRFLDEIPGGMQTHVINLMDSLSDQVDFIHLVCSRTFYGSGLKILNDIPVKRCGSLNIDGSFAFSPSLVYQSIKEKLYGQINMIHLHFPDPMAHFASLVFSRKIPRVITWHAEITKYALLNKYYSPFLKKELSISSAIIVPTVSHQKSSSLLHWSKARNKIKIIPFGFNLKRYKNIRKKEKQAKNLIIFALGRHVPYKGFEVLIDSLKYLPNNVVLCIGGTGPLTKAYEQQVSKLRLDARVTFHGHIPDKNLPEMYHSADIFCLPSITKAEAFGIVQLEAMAAGLPVVSTRLGTGVEEVNLNGVTGFTVKPGDAVELANALQILISNSDIRLAFGQAGQKRAFNKFSLENMKKPTLALYQNLCNAKVE